MSRVGWSEDEDYPGQFALWRANLERSLAGRKGQAALRDLEAAMVVRPEGETDEQRYERLLKWVRSRLKPEPVHA